MKTNDLPIGIENYEAAASKYYIDKTLMVRDLIEKGEGKAILLTRPRRFGKSLALSMVEHFFDIKRESRQLFEGKNIAKERGAVTANMNKYPVIHLNMKGIEGEAAQAILARTKDRIFLLYRQYPELLESPFLDEIERQEFNSVYKKEADDILLLSSLRRLSGFLRKHYGQKVILLIDEYDTPIESAYEHDCYDKVMAFFKPFYGDALKGNDDLYFSLVSGVLQISKESLFSGLNNLVVSSIGSTFLSSYFGFDEAEVCQILDDFSIPLDYETVSTHYGGYYLPGGKEVCNPWSILNFVQERKFRPYWANTGTNALLKEVLQLAGPGAGLLDFLNNGSKKARFSPSISYADLAHTSEASLSFLAQTGYLTMVGNNDDFVDDTYEFRIPNKEIYDVFRTEIIGRAVNTQDMSAALRLKTALLNRNEKEITSVLDEYLLSSLSYYDLGDERNYHNAITGLLSVLFDTHIVRNEVNAGKGRCDIMISPKQSGDFGIVIEIKLSKSKSQISKARLFALAQKALDQIREKGYTEPLIRQGCKEVLLYGLALWGKESALASDKMQLN